jgi:hypothetical protein
MMQRAKTMGGCSVAVGCGVAVGSASVGSGVVAEGTVVVSVAVGRSAAAVKILSAVWFT